MKNFWRRVVRLLQWVPVIWKTHDWDYHYTLDILDRALEELADCLKNGYTASGPRDAERIRYVRNVIKRYQDEVSEGMVYGRHDKKWGTIKGITIPIPDSEFMEWRSVRLNVRTAEDMEQERKEFKRATGEARALATRDWDEIWDTIKKYGRGWWD